MRNSYAVTDSVPNLQQLQAQTHRLGMQTVTRARSLPITAWVMGAGVVLLSTLSAEPALAVLPTNIDQVVPTAVAAGTVDSMTAGVRIMQIVFQVIAAGLGLLALVIPAAAMIKSYRSRKGNDNDDFHSTVFGGLFVMAVGLALALTGWRFSNGLANQVMALT
ncbi:MAG: hypothetical protein AB7T07_15205 [Steroidobacteraceae bacterium]